MHRRWASTAVLQSSLAARLRAASSKPKISTPKPHPRIASLARQYYSLSDAERQSLRQALTLIGKRHAVQLIRKLMALPKTNKSVASLQPTVVAPTSLQKPASTEAPTVKATLPQQQSIKNATGAQPIRPKIASHSPKPPLASTPKVVASQATTHLKTASQAKNQSSLPSKTAVGATPPASGPKPKSPVGSTPTKIAKQDPLLAPPLVGVSGPKAASPSKPTKASSPKPKTAMGPTHPKTASQQTSAASASKPPGASGSTPATSTSSPSTAAPSTVKKAYFSVTDLPEDFFTSHLPKQRRVESPPEAVIKSLL